MAYPGISKRGAKPKGGGTWPLPRGAACQNIFSYALLATAPVENHLLHNEVDQVGIEGEINVKAV